MNGSGAGNWIAETRRFLQVISTEIWKPDGENREPGTGNRRGQASIEFLIMSFLSLAMLGMAVMVYSSEGAEAAEARSGSLMRSICTSLSARVSGLLVAGPGANVRLDYPETIYGQNYSIWVKGDEGLVKVFRESPDGGLSSVGCYMKTRLSERAGLDEFYVPANGSVGNVDGVVVFGE
jgi:hypothetical protein